MPAAPLRGRFVWHELMTGEPDAAARFYPKVTGWGIQSWDEDPSYRMWTVKGMPVGGLMELPAEARQMGTPPSWLMYVGVPDVDATVREATARGARTYVPPRDLSIGRFAVMADPQGATFAVYRPTRPPEGGDEVGLGEFSWHELATTDWRAAWDFYHALFGWELTESMDMGPQGTYQMFGRAGRSLGAVYGKPTGAPGPIAWLCYIRVPSADRAVEAAQRAGGTLLNGPMEVPGGDRIAQFLDPHGAGFAVHSLAAKPATRPARPKAPGRKPGATKTRAVVGKKAAKTRTAKKTAPKRKRPARARKAKGKPAKRTRRR
jgi:predicted enzyme related to lactoylglutathione lyase